MALDEFSDFQGALPVSSSLSLPVSNSTLLNVSSKNLGILSSIKSPPSGNSNTSNGFGIFKSSLENSHGMFHTNNGESNIGFQNGGTVGNRLAKHNLNFRSNSNNGIKGFHNNTQGCLSPSILLPTVSSSSNVQTENTRKSGASNQALVADAGEKDKYSALRELSLLDEPDVAPIENDSSSSNWSCNWSLSPQCEPPLAPTVLNPTTTSCTLDGADSDFGEFQSFSSSSNVSFTESNHHGCQNPIPFNSFGPTTWSTITPVKLKPTPTASEKQGNGILVAKKISCSPDPVRSNDSDSEFGNFVGFTSSIEPAKPFATNNNLTKVKNSTFHLSENFKIPTSNTFTFQPFVSKPPKNLYSTSMSADLADVFSSISVSCASTSLPFAPQEAKESSIMIAPCISPTKSAMSGMDDELVNMNQNESRKPSLDYLSSPDMGRQLGKGKVAEVSPETRSVASLDLGNYVASDSVDNLKSIVTTLDPFNLLGPGKSPKNESNFVENLTTSSSCNSLSLDNETKDQEFKTINTSPGKEYNCFDEEFDSVSFKFMDVKYTVFHLNFSLDIIIIFEKYKCDFYCNLGKRKMYS